MKCIVWYVCNWCMVIFAYFLLMIVVNVNIPYIAPMRSSYGQVRVSNTRQKWSYWIVQASVFRSMILSLPNHRDGWRCFFKGEFLLLAILLVTFSGWRVHMTQTQRLLDLLVTSTYRGQIVTNFITLAMYFWWIHPRKLTVRPKNWWFPIGISFSRGPPFSGNICSFQGGYIQFPKWLKKNRTSQMHGWWMFGWKSRCFFSIFWGWWNVRVGFLWYADFSLLGCQG